MSRTTCAFTGHRPSRFPWGYNEADKDCIVLKEILTSEIIRLTDIGVTQFLSGMAEGVDRWAATIVLALREKTLCLNCTAFCHAKHRQTNLWLIMRIFFWRYVGKSPELAQRQPSTMPGK